MIDIPNRKLISKHIKKGISDYLTFDIDELYNFADYAYVFGGAIRDTICGDEINDVDILCLSQSAYLLESLLEMNGYNKVEYTKNDITSLYKDLQVIFDPFTYFKGDKKVQIIRAASVNDMSSNNAFYVKNFFDILCNVDLSCCGVYYDGSTVKESYPNSIAHCISKSYIQNTNATMYNASRIDMRVNKLNQRGWVDISNNVDMFGSETIDFSEEIKVYLDIIRRDYNIDSILDGY